MTHSSYLGLVSYERLEFIGDSALGCALSNYLFLAYPNLDPGQLTRLRAANVSNEKLARVAIRHGLFKYVRHKLVLLEKKVLEFAIAIQDEEEDGGICGGSINAPNILADIVESLAAAVYIDCNFNLQALWVVFRGLLEPITSRIEPCPKKGKQVDINHGRKGTENIASVFIDRKFIASTSSADKKKTAKLYAANVALGKLDQLKKNAESCNDHEGPYEIREAKQGLNEVCRKKKWPTPILRGGDYSSSSDDEADCTYEGIPNPNSSPVMGYVPPPGDSVDPAHGYQTAPGYVVIDGRPLREPRLPCCGMGFGWFLFIIGFFLAFIPWYLAFLVLVCSRVDYREKRGYVACTIMAILVTIAVIFRKTDGDVDWGRHY